MPSPRDLLAFGRSEPLRPSGGSMQFNVRTSLLSGVFACGVLSGLALNSTTGSDAQAAEKSTLQAQVDDLVAKDAIREQIYNYARGLDRMDRDLALKVW